MLRRAATRGMPQSALIPFTDYKYSIKRVVPFKVHGHLEKVLVPSIIALPWLTGALPHRKANLLRRVLRCGRGELPAHRLECEGKSGEANELNLVVGMRAGTRAAAVSSMKRKTETSVSPWSAPTRLCEPPRSGSASWRVRSGVDREHRPRGRPGELPEVEVSRCANHDRDSVAPDVARYARTLIDAVQV